MTAYSFRRTGCLFLIGAAACLTGLAARAAGSGSASPPALAAQLASRVWAAKTPGARYNAVLAVASALHLPVSTATGKALMSGARGLPSSFNLYDFQLRVAADSLGRHDTMTVAGLAQLYGQAGVKLDGATLARQLSAGVRSTTARSASQASLLGLIVRDLGLHHRPAIDLAKAATRTTQLDPLEAFLIAADSAAHARSARTPAVAGRSDDACNGSTQPGTPPAPLAGSGNGIMRTLLLIQAQEITVVNTPARETHYGPPGHAALAGKVLRLGVKVVIKEKLPDAIRCGLLGGDRDLPQPGPAKNRPIFWNAVDLLKYGTIQFEPENMATGGDGISTLVFKPKSEDFPGFGTEYKATGDVSATVGGPATATVGLLTVSQNWTVGFHKPRGFKFQLPAFSFLNTAGKDKLTITVNDQGRICGDDPYSKAWDVTESVSPGGGRSRTR